MQKTNDFFKVLNISILRFKQVTTKVNINVTELRLISIFEE